MDTLLGQFTRHLWDQSWQIAALTALVAGAAFLLRHRSAHVRHLLWLVVLAKCLVPPLVSVSSPLLPAAPPMVPSAEAFAGPAGASMLSDSALPGEAGPGPMTVPPDTAPAPAPTLRGSLAALDTSARLALVWMLGVAAILLLVGVKAVRTLCWLRRDRTAPPAALQAGISAFLHSLGVRRPPRVWLLRHAGQPFVWGLLRGDIYLPEHLGATGDEHRRDVLAHEASHVLRWDAAVNLLQILAQALYWFHPLVWWANQRIRAEREKSCDEMAIALLRTRPRDYSRAIVEVLRAEQESCRRIPTLAVAGSVKNLEERIRTMLQPGKKFQRRPSLLAAVCALLLAVLIVPTTLALTSRPADKADARVKGTAGPNGAQRTVSANNLKQLGLGLLLYATDHDRKFPDEARAVLPYLRQPQAEPLGEFLSDAAEYLGAGNRIPDGDASGIPLAYDLTLLRTAAGTNVLFADGHVEFLGGDRLKGYGIELPQSQLQIQEVRFEPVHQGKNVVHVNLRNTSEKEQVFAIHIYTRSPDYGASGVGWGTPFFATYAPRETRAARFVFKIQGPVTDRTYVNLGFYNPENQDKYRYARYFERRHYTSAELPKGPPDQAARQPASPAEAQAVTQAFLEIQGYIQNRQYEQAWERFSKDFREAEYQMLGLDAFRRAMEPEHPMHSAFTWERGDFLELKPGQVLKSDGVLTLAAALDGQTWLVDFVQQDGQWKIDWIAGYVPKILDIRNEQEKSPPAPQAKNNPGRESTLQILAVRFEPLRQGKNAVQIQVQNPEAQERAFAVSIQARNSAQGGRFGGWGTALFETLKPGATQWTHFGFKINGPPADSTGIELQFFDPGPAQGFDREKWLARRPWDEWFRQLDYSGRDLPRYQPNAAEWQPASPGDTQAAAAALRQLQKHLENKEYGRAWQLFSNEYRDAEFFNRFEYLQDRLEKPRTVAFPLSRAELLTLEPAAAQTRAGVLALTTGVKNKSWIIRLVNAQGQWVIDAIDPVMRTDAASLQEQQRAVMQAFATFQNCFREQKYEAAWELVTGEIRGQYGNDVKKWKETMEAEAGVRTMFVSLRPESVVPFGELLTLTAKYENQTWKLHYINEDGQWKLYLGQVQRGDWQENLLPTLPKRVTEHFDIYYFKDSTAAKEIDQLARQKDQGFTQICQFLGKDSDTRIRLVLFEDGQTKQMQTGHQGAGWAFGNTIVEVYNEKEKLDPYHETTHILMSPLGHPPALFNEGFATYMSEKLGSHPLDDLGGGQGTIHQRAGELKAKGDWIELSTLLSFREIGSAATRPPVAYAEAGSFVKFLIEEYGKDKFLQAYGTLQNDNTAAAREQNLRKLAEIYGKSAAELEEQWNKLLSAASLQG